MINQLQVYSAGAKGAVFNVISETSRFCSNMAFSISALQAFSHYVVPHCQCQPHHFSQNLTMLSPFILGVGLRLISVATKSLSDAAYVDSARLANAKIERLSYPSQMSYPPNSLYPTKITYPDLSQRVFAG